MIFTVLFSAICILCSVQRRRYFFLSLFLLSLIVIRTLNGVWIGDFWQHSAVVRELAAHPFSPAHPNLNLNAPSVYFTPYTLALGLLARFFHVDSVTILSVMGIANFAFLLFALRQFIGRILGDKDGWTSFLSVLFILFLWGEGPLNFSGFFHWNVLGYVVAYPSTFSMGLVLMMLVWSMDYLDGKGAGRLVLITLASLVVLSHLISAMTGYAGMFAVVINRFVLDRGASGKKSALLISVIPLSLLLAALWPYFSFYGFISGELYLFHQTNYFPYEKLFARTWPVLPGIILLARRLKADKGDMLSWMFIILSGLFLYGLIFGEYAYGRLLSSMVLILQILIAAAVVRWGWSLRKVRSLLIIVLLLAVPFLLNRYYGGAFRQCVPGYPSTFASYRFLRDYTRADDVIISDIGTSWITPTFGGKVIASLRTAVPFVPDHQQRIADLELFFSKQASPEDRLAIINRYHATHILINRKIVAFNQLTEEGIEKLGEIVYTDPYFILVKI